MFVERFVHLPLRKPMMSPRTTMSHGLPLVLSSSSCKSLSVFLAAPRIFPPHESPADCFTALPPSDPGDATGFPPTCCPSVFLSHGLTLFSTILSLASRFSPLLNRFKIFRMGRCCDPNSSFLTFQPHPSFILTLGYSWIDVTGASMVRANRAFHFSSWAFVPFFSFDPLGCDHRGLLFSFASVSCTICDSFSSFYGSKPSLSFDWQTPPLLACADDFLLTLFPFPTFELMQVNSSTIGESPTLQQTPPSIPVIQTI